MNIVVSRSPCRIYSLVSIVLSDRCYRGSTSSCWTSLSMQLRAKKKKKEGGILSYQGLSCKTSGLTHLKMLWSKIQPRVLCVCIIIIIIFFFTFLRRLENYEMCGPNFVAYLSLQLELLEPLWLGDECCILLQRATNAPEKLWPFPIGGDGAWPAGRQRKGFVLILPKRRKQA